MTIYKTYRIVDGKPKWVLVDENDVVVDKSPDTHKLKSAQVQHYKRRRILNTDKELLGYLVEFRKENGRVPVAKDFLHNGMYPSIITYQKRFGSWNNALNLAGLDKREKCGKGDRFTDEELLNFLRMFYEENGKVPGKRDFVNNPAYPDYQNYTAHFGSWGNALKKVGLDIDAMIKKGKLETSQQKGRWVEIIVRDNFEKKPIDLAGNNPSSTNDGICPLDKHTR